MYSKVLSKLIYITVLSIYFLFSSVVSATVLTTIKPLAFIAASLTEGIIETEVLLPDGASPHDYALKPSDLKKIHSADLVIWIGQDMETFLPKIINTIDSNKNLALMEKQTIQNILGKKHGESEREHHGESHHHGQYDAHIWLSPELAVLSAKEIHQKLSELMPEQRVKLNENLANFLNSIQITEQVITEKLSKVKHKGYFVLHDAYGYFSDYFGLNQLGYFTINPVIQPSAKKLHQIKVALAEGKAVCLFGEPQFNQGIIKKIAQGTSVKLGILDPLGSTIDVGKESYSQFLLQLSQQFLRCLS